MNAGNINSSVPGGIIGIQEIECKVNIQNSYNNGEIEGERAGNIIGKISYKSSTDTKTNLENIYYIKEPVLGSGSLISGEAVLKDKGEMKSQTFVNLLNQNIKEHADWKKWKLGENGYPEIE